MAKEWNRIVGGGRGFGRGRTGRFLGCCRAKRHQPRKNESCRGPSRSWSSICCNFLLHSLSHPLIVFHNSIIALVASGGQRFTERDRSGLGDESSSSREERGIFPAKGGIRCPTQGG